MSGALRWIEFHVLLLVPCLAYELTSSRGRHEFLDALMVSAIGRLFRFLPLIIMLATVHHNVLAATWGAFCSRLALNSLAWYQSRYNSRVVFPALVPFLLLAYYFALALTFTLVPEWRQGSSNAYIYVGPVSSTILCLFLALSIFVGKPWAEQHTQLVFPESAQDTLAFQQLNVKLTVYLLVMVSVVVVFAWLTATVWSSSEYESVRAVFQWLNPLVIVVALVCLPLVIEYLRPSRGDEDLDRADREVQDDGYGSNAPAASLVHGDGDGADAGGDGGDARADNYESESLLDKSV